MAGFLARYGNGVLDSVAAHIASWYSHALEADRGPPRLVAMAYLGIVLLIVLLIPIFAILTDSPLGRAMARRLEGNTSTPPALDELAKRVELLESELEDVTRNLETLQEEHQFFQRLLEEGGRRPPPPSIPES